MSLSPDNKAFTEDKEHQHQLDVSHYRLDHFMRSQKFSNKHIYNIYIIILNLTDNWRIYPITIFIEFKKKKFFIDCTCRLLNNYFCCNRVYIISWGWCKDIFTCFVLVGRSAVWRGNKSYQSVMLPLLFAPANFEVGDGQVQSHNPPVPAPFWVVTADEHPVCAFGTWLPLFFHMWVIL